MKSKLFIALALAVLLLFMSVQAVQADGNVNVLKGKAATASSYMLPYEPGRAVDGSMEPISRWVCVDYDINSTQWLQIDLGKYYTCNRWVVKGMGASSWDGSRYNIKGYTLKRGLDSISLDEKDSVENNISGLTDKNTGRFTARYIRLYIDNGNLLNYNWAAVQEFEVYGFETTLPSVTNDVPPVFVNGSTVSIESNIVDDGGDDVTERGVVYSTDINPEITDGSDIKVSSGTGAGVYTTELTGLNSSDTYYARAYAKNIMGISYGRSISFNISRAVDIKVESSDAASVHGQGVTFTAKLTVPVPDENTNTPSGTVNFKAGDAVLDTISISGNEAVFTTAELSIGTHKITAVYNGDSNCDSNTSSILTQTVDKADTTITVESSLNPSVYGEGVTYTSTVSAAAPGSGTPTGTVIFKEDNIVIDTVTLSEGKATLTRAAASVGNHVIKAEYSGDVHYNNSTSSLLYQTVDKADTTITVESSSNPSVYGEGVTYTVTVSAAAPGSGTPTGTVSLWDAGNLIGIEVLDGGKKTFTVSGSPLGNRAITAQYSAYSNYNNSTSSVFTQTVNKADVSVAVESSPKPSAYGQEVTYTATVSVAAPGSGTPAGTITFKDGNATLGTAALSGGIASYTTTATAAGSRSITAEYGGDDNFEVGTSPIYTHIVNKAGTVTSVAINTNPSVYGEEVTYTATVSVAAPGSGTPTGTVTFKDGANIIGNAALNEGIASFTATAGTAGSHSITAEYNGDVSFASSTSTALIQAVNKSGTAVSLVSSQNPSVRGEPVIYTATVSVTAPGSGTPTGTITFRDGAVIVGTAMLSGGTASCTVASEDAGIHGVTAEYAGDDNFEISVTTVLTQIVNRSATAVSLESSSNPSVYGEPVTYTATVSAVAPGSGTPTGIVNFKDGTDTIGTAALSGGTASYTTASAALGNHSIIVEYSGNSSFEGSTSSVFTQIVNEADVSVTAESSPNPSVYGQEVTYTATVSATAPGNGTPTGTVTFKDGADIMGTAALSGGTASYSTTATAAGNRSITAEYNGDGNFAGNTSSIITQTVNEADVSVTVESSPNPSAYGQAVTYTATVGATVLGSGTPTGTVTFKDGTDTIGTAALSGGTASYTAAATAAGSRSITAEYNGDGNFAGNTSSIITQTVNKASVSVTVESSSNPSVYGQEVTYTATVGTVVPGSGTPTGTVTFRDGIDTIGIAALSGDKATFMTTGASVGIHTVTAEYNGDSNFENSTSAVLNQTVNKAATVTSIAGSPNPSVYGQEVTYTATVGVAVPGRGTPTGTVTFRDGADIIGTAALNDGEASCTTSVLSKGTHSITAEYGGNDNCYSSTSTQCIQTIEASDGDKAAADMAALTWDIIKGENMSQNSITSNLELIKIGAIYGSDITWSSSNKNIISINGEVTRPDFSSTDANVTVTAAVYSNSKSASKDFSLKVLKQDQPVLTDADKVAADMAALTWDTIKGENMSRDSVTSDLNLTATGAVYDSTIIWSSSDMSIIRITGEVTRPSFSSGDKDVTVSATVYYNETGAMKDFDLTVSALEKSIYTVSIGAITGGSITANPTSAAEGETINLTLIPSSGNRLKSGTLKYNDGTNHLITGTSFIMPARNVVVSGEFEAIPPSDRERDDDASSGTNVPPTMPAAAPVITVTTAAGNSGPLVNGAATVEAITDANGKAVTAVTVGQLTEIINRAEAEAVKQGTGAKAMAEIRVIAPTGTKAVETSLPKAAVDALAGSKIEALTISTPIAAITFDKEALNTIAGEASEEIRISITEANSDTLSKEARQLIGDRPVYDFRVTSGSNTIHQFAGSITVAIPYTPQPGEDIEAIVIYYINAEGKPEIVSNCDYNPETGLISFTTNHFSEYAVGYNKIRFTDVAEYTWYSKAVSFIAARNITKGTGNGNFSPEAKLTRGQLTVMLMKAYDITPDVSLEDNFSDSGNSWYTGYIAAAKRLGISAGIGNNLFAPEKEITRQEMFNLLYNVLKVTGKLPQYDSGKTLSNFTDAEQIDAWAKEAMMLFVKTGTIGGSAGKLTPLSTTTRAEMAQVLYNLLSE